MSYYEDSELPVVKFPDKVKSIDDIVSHFALQKIMSEPLAYSDYIFRVNAFELRQTISLLILSHLFDKDLIKNNNFLNKKEKDLLITCIDLFHHLYFLEFKEEIKDKFMFLESRFVQKYQNLLSGKSKDFWLYFLEKKREDRPIQKSTQLDFSKFAYFESVRQNIDKDYYEKKELGNNFTGEDLYKRNEKIKYD